MQDSTLWNWVLSGITTILSFVATALWSSLGQLRQDINKLEIYQASIDPQLSEMRRQFDRIEKSLDEILKDLKHKIDKP